MGFGQHLVLEVKIYNSLSFLFKNLSINDHLDTFWQLFLVEFDLPTSFRCIFLHCLGASYFSILTNDNAICSSLSLLEDFPGNKIHSFVKRFHEVGEDFLGKTAT